jgi:hypothetical protein
VSSGGFGCWYFGLVSYLGFPSTSLCMSCVDDETTGIEKHSVGSFTELFWSRIWSCTVGSIS